jgi:hypothetical protein
MNPTATKIISLAITILKTDPNEILLFILQNTIPIYITKLIIENLIKRIKGVNA